LLALHKKTHTQEGQLRQKKKEQAVDLFFSKQPSQAGKWERELYINFRCFEIDSDQKKNCRIDFYRIIAPVGKPPVHVCLEVDEDEHTGYAPECDLRRMTDCYAHCFSVTSELENARVLWIRYNPDKFTIDGKKAVVNAAARRKTLIDFLLDVEENGIDIPDDKCLAVKYMFYSTECGEYTSPQSAYTYHEFIKVAHIL
jgi:hypothetical protein